MFYIINKETRELIRRSETPFNIDATVQPPPPMIQLKRIDINTKPAFNAATQRLNYDFVDDDAVFTRTFSWSVVALTNGELTAATQAASDEASRVQIKAVIADLRNGVGTAAERLARIEKGLAYLLRGEVRR